jgi:hypothetical protein
LGARAGALVDRGLREAARRWHRRKERADDRRQIVDVALTDSVRDAPNSA